MGPRQQRERTFVKPGGPLRERNPYRRRGPSMPLWDPEAITPVRKGESYPLFAAGVVLGFLALLVCYAKGYLLLYGDAVAHLGIARRIVDSPYPGLAQLGGVWLPLPHLLMLPFIGTMSMWQTGMAAVPMSLVSYAASVAGMWRLARVLMRPRWAFVAVLSYALNPNLLYLATTAMTEALFLALLLWTIIAVTEGVAALQAGHVQVAQRRMVLAGVLVFGQVLTRYDGWIVGAAAWTVLTWAWWKSAPPLRERTRVAFFVLTAVCLAGPLLWFWYNAHFEGDWLDFMRGPYSAAAIEKRTSHPGVHYPGWHNPLLAGVYYLRAAQLDAAMWETGFALLGAALAGAWIAVRRRRLPSATDGAKPTITGSPTTAALCVFLLWLPLPFYMYSIAFGAVPIFTPVLPPRAFYNVRYGMEMLPALCFFAALALDRLDTRLRASTSKRQQLAGRLLQPIFAMLCVLNAIGMMAGVGSATFLRGAAWKVQLAMEASRGGYIPAARRYTYPLVLQEGLVNATTRVPFEHVLASALMQAPANEPVLMSTSAHVGAAQTAGRSLRSMVSENDKVTWDAALADPAHHAAYVIAVEGDLVAKAVAAHPVGLQLLEVVRTTGQPMAEVYRSTLWKP